MVRTSTFFTHYLTRMLLKMPTAVAARLYVVRLRVGSPRWHSTLVHTTRIVAPRPRVLNAAVRRTAVRYKNREAGIMKPCAVLVYHSNTRQNHNLAAMKSSSNKTYTTLVQAAFTWGGWCTV
jgi:hypothetical protein